MTNEDRKSFSKWLEHVRLYSPDIQTNWGFYEFWVSCVKNNALFMDDDKK
jgi:hypothetical protein